MLRHQTYRLKFRRGNVEKCGPALIITGRFYFLGVVITNYITATVAVFFFF